jgi:membrane AbrB-like protein
MGDVAELAVLGAAAAAGAVGGRWLRLPMWPFTGPLLVVGVCHGVLGLGAELPGWWALTAQVLVGTAVGGRLGRGLVAELRPVAGPLILVVVTLVPLGVALGLLIHVWSGVPVADAVFGMVPGGVGEMVAATTSLDGNSALVAGMHLVRLLVVVWTVHLLVRLLRRRGAAP